jgi:hypothetical protein
MPPVLICKKNVVTSSLPVMANGGSMLEYLVAWVDAEIHDFAEGWILGQLTGVEDAIQIWKAASREKKRD